MGIWLEALWEGGLSFCVSGCTPRRCGRGVSDVVITREEAERIRR